MGLIRNVPGEGGGGQLIVATRSDNSNPAVFADFAALETYTATTEGTADAARINVTDADDAEEVFAVGTLNASNQVTAITAAYIRISPNWVAVATNLVGTPGAQGPAGTPGSDGQGVDFTGIEDGQYLIKQGSSTAGASLSETSDEIVSTKSIAAPDASLMLGGTLASNAGFNIAVTLPGGEVFYPVAYQNEATGSGEPRIFRTQAQGDTPAAANTSETFTGSNLQFRISNTNTGFAEQYTFITAGASEVTDCNIIIRVGSHTSNPPFLFDYKRATGGTGFSIPARTDTDPNNSANQFTVDLPGEGLFFRQGQDLFVTIEAGSGQSLSLYGQTLAIPLEAGGTTNETVPYVAVFGQMATPDQVLTETKLVDGTNITKTYDAATGNVTLAAEDNYVNAVTADVASDGTLTLTLNRTGALGDVDDSVQFIAGTNVTFDIDEANDTITINSAGGGGTTPPQAQHTNYIDVTTDNNSSSVDVANAVSSDDLNPTVTLETFTGNRYVQILQSQAHTAFTSIVISGINQLGGFTVNENARTISGQAYRQYVTTNLITDALSGAEVVMGGAT